MDKTINVIYQFNEKYVPYAGVSMTSLLANNPDADEINIYVLGEDLSEDSVEKIKWEVSAFDRNVFFPDTFPLLERFRGMGMIPYRGAYSVYLRLFFDELLPRDTKRVLYLDADTVVDGSILPLINSDLHGKSIGMVLESIRDDYKVMIGMGRDSDYYNSGVILYDVEKWRANHYGVRLTDHIRNVRSSYIGDQDFLNIVCEGDVARLPIKYNFQPLHGRYSPGEYFKAYGAKGYYSEEELEAAPEEAVILHCYRWLGEFPWNLGNLHPFTGIFDRYLMMSMWKDYEKERADKGFALSVEKLLYRILPRPMFIRVFKKAHQMMLGRAEKDARRQKTNQSA